MEQRYNGPFSNLNWFCTAITQADVLNGRIVKMTILVSIGDVDDKPQRP